MKQKFFLLSFLFLLIVICSFHEQVQVAFEQPGHFPPALYDFSKNSPSIAKREIGRALFYDPLLSRNKSISCASCHSPYSAFSHNDHALSHGIDDKIGNRNAPALINLAWKKSFMYDGAINHLDVQALAPISNPVEMDENFAQVIDKLAKSPIYPSLFFQAYGDSLITGERTLKCISQFLLNLVSAQSKYDSVMNQLSVFTQQEKQGYLLFQKHCSSCHTEPLFTNTSYANNGLPIDPILKDVGRYKITQQGKDSLQFMVPTLRNIEYTFPYMHDGRFQNLNQVLQHYSDGIEAYTYLSKELNHQLHLNSNERVDLIAFLLTLSDRNFIHNSKLQFPRELLLQQKKESIKTN